MKTESIKVENFAGLRGFEVNFSDSITYLVGPNAAGKSTIGKTAFFFGLEGIAEKGTTYKGRSSFIGEWGDEAKTVIKLRDDNGSYTVTRSIHPSGQKLTIVSDKGEHLDQRWLDKLFKSLMVSPLDFAQLTPKEQAKELGIDTSEFDQKISEKKLEFTVINRELSNFGEIEIPAPCERADISKLNRQKNDAVAFNKEQEERKRALESKKAQCNDLDKQIEELSRKLQIAKMAKEDRLRELAQLPLPEPEKDISIFDKVIEELAIQNQEAYKYEQALEKSRQKEQKKAELEANKLAQKQLQQQKVEYLQSLNLPFTNLTIEDDGGLLMDGRPIREPYFSSGQLLKIIPQIISHLQPELKYLFIQQFDLLDKKNQKEIIDILLGMGFQLCIEVVKETESGGVVVLKEKIDS